MDLDKISSKCLAKNSDSVCGVRQNESILSAKYTNNQRAEMAVDKALYNLPKTSVYFSEQPKGAQIAFSGNFFSKLFVPFFNDKNSTKLYNELIRNTSNLSKEELLRFYRKVFSDIEVKDLEKLSHNINYLKNGEKLSLLDIYIGESDFDYRFALDMCEKLNRNLQGKGVKLVNNFEYENLASKGKDVVKMSDAELRSYYTAMVPFINKTELDYLINQVHRIQKGEPRFLNTSEEGEILSTLKVKQQCGMFLKGLKLHKGLIDPSEYPKANIPFIKKDLTDFQKTQLSGWTWSGADPVRLERVFDDVAVTLEQDTYLYRGINLVPKNKKSVDYFNNIKVGSIIDNSERYISTAKSIETSLTYSVNKSYGLNQFYILKIKVPAGTKGIDNRISEGLDFDEFILPPNKLKVTGIDYNTGVVECEYINL